MVVHKKQMGQGFVLPHLFFRELCPQIRTKENLESVSLQHFQGFPWVRIIPIHESVATLL
jgi:hypothetical protein